MRRSLRKLRTYVGRLIRDIRRKTTDIDEGPAALLDRAELPACALIRRLNRLTGNRQFDRLNELIAG